MARLVGRWTKVAAATIKLRALLHFSHGTYHHNDVPDSYASLDLPPACLYGVSTLVLPLRTNFRATTVTWWSSSTSTFPISMRPTRPRLNPWHPFEGLLEAARTDPPAEDQSDTVVHGVLLATYLTQCARRQRLARIGMSLVTRRLAEGLPAQDAMGVYD